MSDEAWINSATVATPSARSSRPHDVRGQQREGAAHPLGRRQQRVAHRAVHGLGRRVLGRHQLVERVGDARLVVNEERRVRGRWHDYLPKISRYWNGRNVSCASRRSPAASASSNHALGGDAVVGLRARAEPVRLVVDDAEPAVALERLGEVAQQRLLVLHLVVGVHDQHHVELLGRQPRVLGGAEHGADVAQALALHATRDGLDHLRLHVLGVDAAVRARRDGPAGR